MGEAGDAELKAELPMKGGRLFIELIYENRYNLLYPLVISRNAFGLTYVKPSGRGRIYIKNKGFTLA